MVRYDFSCFLIEFPVAHILHHVVLLNLFSFNQGFTPTHQVVLLCRRLHGP